LSLRVLTGEGRVYEYELPKKKSGFSRKMFSLRSEYEIKGENSMKIHVGKSFVKKNYQSPPKAAKKIFEL